MHGRARSLSKQRFRVILLGAFEVLFLPWSEPNCKKSDPGQIPHKQPSLAATSSTVVLITIFLPTLQ